MDILEQIASNLNIETSILRSILDNDIINNINSLQPDLVIISKDNNSSPFYASLRSTKSLFIKELSPYESFEELTNYHYRGFRAYFCYYDSGHNYILELLWKDSKEGLDPSSLVIAFKIALLIKDLKETREELSRELSLNRFIMSHGIKKELSREPVNAIQIENDIIDEIKSYGFGDLYYIERLNISEILKLLGIANLSNGILFLILDSNNNIFDAYGDLSLLSIDLKLFKNTNISLYIESSYLKLINSLKGAISIETEFGYSSRRRVSLSALPLDQLKLLLVKDIQSEISLNRFRELFYRIADDVEDLFIIADSNGFITSVNSVAEKLLKFKKEDLIGKPLSVIIEDRFLSDYLSRKRDLDLETYIKDKSNTMIRFYVHMRYYNISPSDQFFIIAHYLEDTYRIESLEKALKTANKALTSIKSESQLKSQFIYNITHELKTPLTSISGFARLLYNSSESLNDVERDYLKTIIDESERLYNIINQVLEAIKFDSQRVRLDITRVNLRKLYENSSIKALEEAARLKGLEFKWIVDYDVPEISADLNRIIQVLVNLIGNAIKYTDKGSITVHFYRKGRKFVRCDVKDTGIGISEEDRRKLFRDFYQVQNKELVVQPRSGTGLGLSIVKSIIKLHHGKVGVESELGKGSTFYFIIPIEYKPDKASK
ncbi:MAG: methanogenesis regulatory histidine kinase FilI [Candidatus Micrarchaeota archaeon]|nr:MAG: methanogenesis regulatory histidine kinase FilI [Candidatus Micrarchaeota archaeon]